MAKRALPNLLDALAEISELVEISRVAFPPYQWQLQPWALLERAVSFPSATSKAPRETNRQNRGLQELVSPSERTFSGAEESVWLRQVLWVPGVLCKVIRASPIM